MNNYEKYLDGKNYVQEISEKDCLAKRKEFYKCVKDKKNELTKSTTNWNNYNNIVRTSVDECFESNGLDSCSNLFSKAELNY